MTMWNRKVLFIASCVLTLMYGAVCFGQAKLSYPEANPSAVAVECAKNPALPECAALQQKLQIPVGGGNIEQPGAYSDHAGIPQQGSTSPEPPTLHKEEPTEFQQFVTTSVGRELSLFGYSLFEQVPSTFAPADRVPVTADYVIGPGDELLIRAWGQIDLNARVTVDRTGSIYLPRVGSLPVAGVQYRQLPDVLKSSIGRIFRNFDLTVSLGQLRSIQVFVVGNARRPGAYTVSSLSTLVNTLFASGGPSNRGSMRDIQLKRNGEVVTHFDLYDLLLKGDKSKDIVLQPGDVIYIPPVGPQVAMFGSVNLPAIYELGGTGATLKSGLELAGGLTNLADGARVVVDRIDNRTTHKVDEFKLDGGGLSRQLRDGDVVRVFSITPKFDNAITLRGNVAQPGRYPWHEGMRIRDLIPSREFLLTRAFWEQQNLSAREKKFGTSQSEMAQRKQERSAQESEERQQESKMVIQEDSRSANQPEQPKEVLKTEELKNDVKRNAPEINWEYAVIQRLDPVSLTTSLIPFNLRKAILENDDAENKVLQPGDIITIFSQADIAVGIEKQSKFVRLEGEVAAPGVYKVEPGETLREVVARAGGLTSNAYLFGSEFTRESVKKEQQRSLDEMVRSAEQDLQRKITELQARPDQQANLAAQTQSDRVFINKLRALKPAGRIVLELKPTELGIADIPNLPLEDGDRFLVPHMPATVTVMGAVNSQSSFIFKEHTPIKKYLALAGNGTRLADSKHMFLIRADGTVVSRDQMSSVWGGGFDSLKALPGDLLVVPTQMDKGAFMRGLKDWTQVISQFALGITAIHVLTD